MSGARIEVASRRDFLASLFSAGALILGASVASAKPFPQSVSDSSAQWNPNVWVGVNPDGSVTIVTHRSEMGTGIRTSMPMIVADEMEADWSRVSVHQAVGDKEKYGSQNTDGSCSVRDFYDTMRQAGATARIMLVNAAAAQWNVPATECRAENHTVVHTASGRKIGYGELAQAASRQPVPDKSKLTLKDSSQFRYIGKGVPIVDLEDICTGKAVFGYDAHLPGMLHASIERSPVIGGRFKSVDDSAAKQVAGVRQVIQLEPAKPPYQFQALGGVAVLADNTWAARQGRKKLNVEWEEGPNASFSTSSFKEQLIATVSKPQKVVRSGGDVDAALGAGGKSHEAVYYTPLLAHTAMEPPAAVAQWENGKVEIWAATQNPQAVQSTVADALGIKPEDVICHVTLLGGGFGRKSKPDYVAEAAILSKKSGKPVKVAWTREEDISFDFFHTTSAMYFKAALDANGKPSAWLQRTAFPSIGSTFNASAVYPDAGELSMGFIDVPYQIDNFRAENGPAQAHVRIGWLRSVSNIYHAFGVQSFTDELAHLAGKDPVEYYLSLLGPDRKLDFKAQKAEFSNYGKSFDEYPFDTARLRRVAEVAAEKSGWSNARSGKRAVGFAAHRSFLTYVAGVAQVDVSPSGGVSIPRIDLAVDCGPLINPDRVKAQFEGAAVFGASVALLGEITAAGGKIEQRNFNNYRVARMNEAPREIHIHIVENRDALPTGVGEPGVPPIAPAIYNAVFAATGKRFRELPLKNQKLA